MNEKTYSIGDAKDMKQAMNKANTLGEQIDIVKATPTMVLRDFIKACFEYGKYSSMDMKTESFYNMAVAEYARR